MSPIETALRVEEGTKWQNCPVCGYATSIKKAHRNTWWHDLTSDCPQKGWHLHWACRGCGAVFSTPSVATAVQKVGTRNG